MYMSFRQVPFSALTLQYDKMYFSPRHIGQGKTSDLPNQTHQLDQDNRNSKTNVQLQSQMLVGNTLEKEISYITHVMKGGQQRQVLN